MKTKTNGTDESVPYGKWVGGVKRAGRCGYRPLRNPNPHKHTNNNGFVGNAFMRSEWRRDDFRTDGNGNETRTRAHVQNPKTLPNGGNHPPPNAIRSLPGCRDVIGRSRRDRNLFTVHLQVYGFVGRV